MSASWIPRPGGPFGPCRGECDHRECLDARRQADAKCELCPLPIGYEVPFFERESAGFVHARCAESEAHHVATWQLKTIERRTV